LGAGDVWHAGSSKIVIEVMIVVTAPSGKATT